MSDKVVPINCVLYELLVTQGMNNFTALALRDRFLELSDELSSDEARQYVYRHLSRLQNLEYINKLPGQAGQKPVFIKTEHFIHVCWDVHESLSPLQRNKPPFKTSTSVTRNELREKLERAEQDFISCIEESKTYTALAEQYPALAEQLSKTKELAERQSAKLMGEIRAFKMAISIHD